MAGKDFETNQFVERRKPSRLKTDEEQAAKNENRLNLMEQLMNTLNEKTDLSEAAVVRLHARMDDMLLRLSNLSTEVKATIRQDIEASWQRMQEALANHIATEAQQDAARLQVIEAKLETIETTGNERGKSVIDAIGSMKEDNRAVRGVIVTAVGALIVSGVSLVGGMILFLFTHAEKISKFLDAMNKVSS